MNLKYLQNIKETPVAILEENELPAWENAGQVLDALNAMGAGMIRYPAIRWGLHSFGKSDFLPEYPELNGRNLFGEIFHEMTKAGKKVMAYCHYGVLHQHVAELKPEWRGKNADGSPARWNGEDHHYRACMANEDFTFHMKKAIHEVCRQYPVDALYIDGPTWYGDCWCPSCGKKYQDEYNEVMPAKLSFKDGSQQKYNKIRDRAVEKIVKDLREELKGFPRLPLLFNMTMRYIPTHRTGIPEITSRHADGGNTTEVHRPGSFWEMYQSVRLGESLGKISMCYLPPGPYETLRNFSMKEMDVLAGTYLMHGATPMLGTLSTFLNDKSAGKLMTEQVKKFQVYPEAYHRSRPVKHLGLVYSRTSAENSAGYDREVIHKKFGGAFRALLNEHIHFDTFFDTELNAEKLSAYKAVFIPGGTSLKISHIEALKNYISNGGGLLATGNFTLVNPNGEKLDNFAASELLGVDFKGHEPSAPYRPREYRETAPRYGYSMVPEAYLKLQDKRISEIIQAQNKLTPISDAQVGLPELGRWIKYNFVETHEKTEILAKLFLPSGGAFGKPMSFPFGTPPGITLNHYGKGKVIYLASPIEEYYERRRLPETRKLIRKLVNILTDNDFVFESGASPGLIMNISGNSGVFYLHLLNYNGAMHEDGYAVECVTPLKNIKIRLGKMFSNTIEIKTLWTNKKIDFKEKDTIIEFCLPELETFETLIIRRN